MKNIFIDISLITILYVLQDNIQNFIDPINIFASHDFACNDSSEFCKTCPIESRNSRSRSAQVLLPFDKGCGDDRVCNSNIQATVKLLGVGYVTVNIRHNILEKTFILFTLLKYKI